MSAFERLQELGFTLPAAAPPAASYVPVTRSGNILYVSGQISGTERGTIVGKLGRTMGTEEGQKAAQTCALRILAQVVHNGGVPLDSIRRILKLTVLVNSTPDFLEHHFVANGASDLLIAVLGEKGAHARAAFGVAAIPTGAAVEIDAVVEVAE
jgi:enamine deaminase RidA (YjgF/YER057c/UK114 family)